MPSSVTKNERRSGTHPFLVLLMLMGSNGKKDGSMNRQARDRSGIYRPILYTVLYVIWWITSRKRLSCASDLERVDL